MAKRKTFWLRIAWFLPFVCFNILRAADCVIDAFGDANRPNWTVETPKAGASAGFAFQDGALAVKTGELDPARSTVRLLLPGDGPQNGAKWAAAKAKYISFYCKSDKPVGATFHLLQRGKTAGTYQAPFNAAPGDWQRVVLPMEAFGLKTFSAIAGIGVRAVAGQPDATILLRDFSAGAPRFTDESFRGDVLTLPLNGAWKFKTDNGEEGMAGKWFAENFDASSWRSLDSGTSWESQGVEHFGWGWYRKEFFVPERLRGADITVRLPPMKSDDECWINGIRIGGISGEYKYDNMMARQYRGRIHAKYGVTNSITVRCWGGNLTFIGKNSGLIKGPLEVVFDPWLPGISFMDYDNRFNNTSDVSDAQQGKTFAIGLPFPYEIEKASEGGKTAYVISDYQGEEIKSGDTVPPISMPHSGPNLLDSTGTYIQVDGPTAQEIYLRGRFKLSLRVEDKDGGIVYMATREFDHLNFTKRDTMPLPELPPKTAPTPYGNLRLIDVIDCATPLANEPHPYLEGAFDNRGNLFTPAPRGNAFTTNILGSAARESGYGWFAYRIGRGKLKPRSTYLVRIRYPEDKPRFAPVEFQTGQNFYDAGWKNGVAPDDVYDNWPLSGKWEWYDAVITLDDQTVGAGGTQTASAENGFWIYFMNKMKPGQYYAMWQGGPAVSRIELYEIDPELHSPKIRWPEGNAPRRTLAFDWERQPDHVPEDLVKYAKLMGYSAISPVILKWFFANYADPFPGYESMWIDARDYWAHKDYAPGPAPVSQHARYLAATKKWGVDYIPRVEWGGSQSLPEDARAIAPDGKPTKPNRFAPWCSNLLNPATAEDFKKYLAHIIAPHAADNPQLKGVHWRIRCQRLPPSYSEADIKLFAQETGAKLPGGGYAQWAAWASGEAKAQYDDWWHGKRAAFHAQIAEFVRGMRGDLRVWHFNWDPDKIGIIEPDITAWAFVQHVVNAGAGGGRAVYEKERAVRKSFTAEDYVSVLRTGNFGAAFNGLNRADLGIRPELYKNIPGFEIFAPAHYRCYADMPDYLNYFRTAEGVAASHCVSYDEIGSRVINPKYEGNMIVPGGADFSMALELLAWFHADARTLNYTVYTYGRGFADAHRRFAQAFLALPATDGTEIAQGDPDVKARVYGDRVGVGHKGNTAKKTAVKIPAPKTRKITDLVTGKDVPFKTEGGSVVFEIQTAPMGLYAFKLE